MMTILQSYDLDGPLQEKSVKYFGTAFIIIFEIDAYFSIFCSNGYKPPQFFERKHLVPNEVENITDDRSQVNFICNVRLNGFVS